MEKNKRASPPGWIQAWHPRLLSVVVTPIKQMSYEEHTGQNKELYGQHIDACNDA